MTITRISPIYGKVSELISGRTMIRYYWRSRRYQRFHFDGGIWFIVGMDR